MCRSAEIDRLGHPTDSTGSRWFHCVSFTNPFTNRRTRLRFAGIEVAILSSIIGGVEEISDALLAVSTARRVNDFLAAEVAARGGRFADHATVAPHDIGAAVTERTRRDRTRTPRRLSRKGATR
jgi:predicted TIM-barrel fold metal-dependent hydrolase